MAVEMEIHPSVLNSAPGSDEAVAAQARKDRAERIKGYREAPDPSSSNEEPTLFSPPGHKLTIGSLDDDELEVEAQYNPRELQLATYIQWQMQMSPTVDRHALEFSGDNPRTFQIELMFDGFEEAISVEPQIAKLNLMASASVEIEANDVTMLRRNQGSGRPKVRTIERPPQPKKSEPNKAESGESEEESPDSSSQERVKRPHFCVVMWGKWVPKPLTCVIETITTKYQMFSENGEPLRAVVSLSLKEATSVGVASEEARRRAAERYQENLDKGVDGGYPRDYAGPRRDRYVGQPPLGEPAVKR